MWFYDMCGVFFTNDFIDVVESFYINIAGRFHDVCVFIQKIAQKASLYNVV